ncbi:hypothetical protein [Cryobacterium sp. Y82]|uniref:hypothetical protein n=1 Tax=Cryobacterium sp. Y82 TaxID=2045017 RepID=UPI0011AFE6FA|nr:hypothetical protein [Cryobacterium sp. Y82]
MFLRYSARARSNYERGSSLLAVIGLMGVAAIATLAIAGSTMNSLGVSSAARAGVQAQAAAEAGIDAALLNLTKKTCVDGKISSTTDPVFEAFITLSSNGTDFEDDTPSCPDDSTKRLKIVSTGHASQLGQAGNKSGNERKVEAIYDFDAATTETPATGLDTAMYSYKNGGFGGSSQLHWKDTDVATDVSVVPNAARPVVHIKTGNASCGSPAASSAIIEADIVVEEGSFLGGGSCIISGNVRADGDLSLSGTAQIFGSAWATGLSTVGADSWIHNDLTTKAFAGKSTRVKKILTIDGDGIDPPIRMATEVPDWVDIDYVPSDWTKQGFTIIEVSKGCNMQAIQEVLTPPSGAAPVGPVVINAIECSAGIKIKENTTHLVLPNDLAIFASSFDIGLNAQVDGVGSDRKLWLITPDDTPNKLPTCKNASYNSSVSQSFIVNTTVTAMLYSPCHIKVGTGDGHSAQWHGQFYGGEVSFTGSSQLNFAAIGIPGTALTSGETPGSAAAEAKLGDRISIRDVNVRDLNG